MHSIIDILQQSLTESVHVHVLILEVCACGLPQLYYNNNIQENNLCILSTLYGNFHVKYNKNVNN